MSSLSALPTRPGQPNRLIHEKSPYLLQHALNPVDWHPWGDEAFEKARRENKPLFLSIGYSTCHWCHVMERESFEDEAVAALLNEHFVAVKVDREERPDVDRVYMSAMQAMGAGGGWPLNVFLTPDGKPFAGGTYFPPRSTAGRPGMTELLPQVHAAWLEMRERIEETGDRVFAALASLEAPAAESLDRDLLVERCYRSLERMHDRARGGFGEAPKFPSGVNLDFLFRYHARDPRSNSEALGMALRQLDAMLAGGIHDHLGGGFHRYSTDADWLVPHFEKMLYDQAQLAWAYLDAFQLTGRDEYAAAARGILDYVRRDLASPAGAFCSAEDADSEGEEGRFYVWTPLQIEAVLGRDDAALFGFHYGVTPCGNFERGASILHAAHPLDETARSFGLAAEDASARLAEARAKLLAARAQRVRPHRDDKVLAAWNGLMISACARAARVLGDEALLAAGERAGQFVWAELRDGRTGEMRRRWRDGEAAGVGQLDDYAHFTLGCVDLYRASLDPAWLERAVAVTEAQNARFWDESGGGFFESPPGDPHLKLRLKDDFDGAEIAGASIAAGNLLTLGALLDRADWRERARRTLDLYAGRLAHNPLAMPQMLVAMDLEQSAPRHVVVAGARGAADTRSMVREFDRRFLPHDVLVLAEGGERGRRLAALAPFTAALGAENGRATAYVCVGYACRLPTTDLGTFAAQLDERPAARALEETT